ncbi:MAG: hypothetical protein ACOC9R_02935 [bacterium]
MSRDLITDVLDAVGLAAVAAGVGAGAAQWVGWFGLAVAGAVVLAGVQLSTWLAGRADRGER